MKSQFFSPRAVRTLSRIGDLLAPGGNGFPSFSEARCIQHLDGVLRFVPDGDRGQLRLLLAALTVAPDRALRALMRASDRAATSRAPAVLRQINVGVRGLVWSLYYSGESGLGVRDPLEVIGYRVSADP